MKFLTISALSEGFYKEKGSRFMGFAYPAQSEEEIKNILENLHKLHPKARHVCFAWRLGADKANFKYSDDGEPHNSAGQPIMGQIKSYDVTNVVVAVVRYFGGVKLGVGGLVTAYKTAAQEALQNAVIVEDEERILFTLETEYGRLSELLNFVRQKNVRILEQVLNEICLIKVLVPASDAADITQYLEKLKIKIHK